MGNWFASEGVDTDVEEQDIEEQEGDELYFDDVQTNEFFNQFASVYLIAMPCKFTDGSQFCLMIRNKTLSVVYETTLNEECVNWTQAMGLRTELLVSRDPLEIVKRSVLGEDHEYRVTKDSDWAQLMSTFTHYVCLALKQTHTLIK